VPDSQYDHDVATRVGHRRIDGYDLAAWTDQDLEDLALNLGIRRWEHPDDPEPEPQAPGEERTELVQELREALHGALDQLLGYRRDVTELQFGERRYWLTGGMSWGDTPTDAYEWVAALDWIGLYDEPLPDAE
jgi:hypothetical protein